MYNFFVETSFFWVFRKSLVPDIRRIALIKVTVLQEVRLKLLRFNSQHQWRKMLLKLVLIDETLIWLVLNEIIKICFFLLVLALLRWSLFVFFPSLRWILLCCLFFFRVNKVFFIIQKYFLTHFFQERYRICFDIRKKICFVYYSLWVFLYS